MIAVLPEKDIENIRSAFLENGLEYTESSGMVTAKSGNEILGRCLFYLDKDFMEILKLFPEDDLLIADGVLRSTIHIACERFVMNITYSEKANSRIFKTLGFIKDETKRTLNPDKLFVGCACDNKNQP